MNVRGIEINQKSNYLLTNGLGSLSGHEFKIRMLNFDVNEYVSVLSYLIDYCIDSKPGIKPEQTISYHSWLLKCVLTSDSYYNLWEANKDGEYFIEGVDYSVKVIQEQQEMCKKFNVL